MTIKEMKGNAKENLLPYLGFSVVITLFATLMKNAISLIAALPVSGTGFMAFITYEIAFFISSLLIAVIQTGLSKYFLTMATVKAVRPLDIFYGFTHKPDKILLVTLVVTLIRATCMTPYAICASLIPLSDDTATLILLFLFSLLCECIAFVATIPFSFIYFIMIDMPELSFSKTLKMSCYLMKKRFFRYLALNLSFFPLMAIAYISFGIGMLWVEPYMNATLTEFYLDAACAHEN